MDPAAIGTTDAIQLYEIDTEDEELPLEKWALFFRVFTFPGNVHPKDKVPERFSVYKIIIEPDIPCTRIFSQKRS